MLTNYLKKKTYVVYVNLFKIIVNTKIHLYLYQEAYFLLAQKESYMYNIHVLVNFKFRKWGL